MARVLSRWPLIIGGVLAVAIAATITIEVVVGHNGRSDAELRQNAVTELTVAAEGGGPYVPANGIPCAGGGSCIPGDLSYPDGLAAIDYPTSMKADVDALRAAVQAEDDAIRNSRNCDPPPPDVDRRWVAAAATIFKDLGLPVPANLSLEGGKTCGGLP